tara:strand:+ start:3924 stop:4760 length:837 start_codon:yes stop_codon:yes gene_type:complete
MAWYTDLYDAVTDFSPETGIGSGFAGGLGSALIGGGLSYLGAQESGDAARAAAQTQADAIRSSAASAEAAANPWNVGSLGGTTTFDPESKSALLNLSPELTNIYSGLLSRSGLFGQQANAYSADPMMAANQFYNQQQEYFQPREDRARTDLETRLLAQGRLGSTGGQRQYGELEESILAQQNQRQTAAYSQSQMMIDQLLGRESGDIGQAVGLLDVPQQQGNLAMGIGGQLGSAAATGLAARSAAAQTLGQANAQSTLGSVGSQLGGLFAAPKPYERA